MPSKSKKVLLRKKRSNRPKITHYYAVKTVPYTNLRKGPWTEKEDELLKDWVEKVGPKTWTRCALTIPGRSGKQCREHWNNSLNSSIVKGNWSSEEDFLIMAFYKKYDGSWKKMIPIFKSRTENSIKNRFYSQLRKIAARNIKTRKKEYNSKFGLNILMKFLDLGFDEAKNEFLKTNKMNEGELELYIKKIENLVNNRVRGQKFIEFKNIEKYEEKNSNSNINIITKKSSKISKKNSILSFKESNEGENIDNIINNDESNNLENIKYEPKKMEQAPKIQETITKYKAIRSKNQEVPNNNVKFKTFKINKSKSFSNIINHNTNNNLANDYRVKPSNFSVSYNNNSFIMNDNNYTSFFQRDNISNNNFTNIYSKKTSDFFFMDNNNNSKTKEVSPTPNDVFNLLNFQNKDNNEYLNNNNLKIDKNDSILTSKQKPSQIVIKPSNSFFKPSESMIFPNNQFGFHGFTSFGSLKDFQNENENEDLIKK